MSKLFCVLSIHTLNIAQGLKNMNLISIFINGYILPTSYEKNVWKNLFLLAKNEFILKI